jgi:hypothetical protein
MKEARRRPFGIRWPATVMVLIGAIATAPLAGANEGPAPARRGELWVSRFDGGTSSDSVVAMALSPDDSRVFVTGRVESEDYIPSDIETIAYDAGTGTPLWEQRWDGPGHEFDDPEAIAVSPDGTKVFVTGSSDWGNAQGVSNVTLAYDAAAGTKLWQRLHKSGRVSVGRAVAVSPDSSIVYVTGLSGAAYGTFAYDADTGSILWFRQFYSGTSTSNAIGVALSPDGSTVFVTGSTHGEDTHDDYATIAYDAATGDPRWVRFFNAPSNTNDEAESIAVSPDGTEVFVAGTTWDTTDHYSTVAYAAATGLQLWVQMSKGTGYNDDAFALAVSPDGSGVFVTGRTELAGSTRWDYGTLAYDARTGARLWKRLYNGPGDETDTAAAITVSPDDANVLVTGASTGVGSGLDFGTVVYDAATGALRSIRRFNGPGNGDDSAKAVAVSPDGSIVLVSGTCDGGGTGNDFCTVAYAT